MKGGDVEALTSLEKTLLKKKIAVTHVAFAPRFMCSSALLAVPESHAVSKIYDRLRTMPDTLAAIVVGSIKAVARSRQCRLFSAQIHIFHHEFFLQCCVIK